MNTGILLQAGFQGNKSGQHTNKSSITSKSGIKVSEIEILIIWYIGEIAGFYHLEGGQ